VPHTKREDFSARFPLHVTLRVQPGVGHLRAYRPAQVILGALRACQERFGTRVVHFSIQGTHLHMLIEAEGAPALSRTVQALAMQIAKGLNACARRRGSVFVDRYHYSANPAAGRQRAAVCPREPPTSHAGVAARPLA
jgi:hypothetical protein